MPSRICLTFLLAASFILLRPGPIPVFAQDARTFKDWAVVCETAAICTALTSKSGRTDSETYSFKLMLRRDWNEGSTIKVRLQFSNAEPRNGSPFIFEVDDGRAFRFEDGAGYQRAGKDFELVDQEQANLLINTLRQGDRLYITFINPQARETGLGFSLAGVTASLLWMSEQGQVTATGSGTEVVKQSGDEIPELVANLHRADGVCTGYGDAIFAPEVFSLTEDESLFILNCTSGAYNFGSRLYHYDQRYSEVRILHFADYSDDYGWGGTDVLFNVSFDPATNTLNSFSKGRGLGDCGSAAIREWSDYGFKLVEFRYWETCDGTRMPADWPTIFQMK